MKDFIRLRAIVGVYEDAIKGEIAIHIGRSVSCYAWENEEYPDGDTCKEQRWIFMWIEQPRALKKKNLTCKRERNVYVL